MFGRTNPLNQRLSPRQKRVMAIVSGAVVLIFIGLGIWGSLAPDSYGTSANGCVNVTIPGTTGGSILHHCGSAARAYCHSSALAGSGVIAVRSHTQCRLAGLLPDSSASPSPSH